MDNQYDYIIGVHKLSPPIGLYNYKANVISLTKTGPNKECVEFLEPRMAECVGVSQTEAIEQIEKEVRRWMASHN
jgi:hypothetical protein